jgi:CrcB protein
MAHVPRTPLTPLPRSAPPALLIYAAVLAGGMLGGTLRYLVTLGLPTEAGQIPWGTLAVNLVGAFVLALLLSGWVRRGHVAHPWRPFLATGILGSFTTWSALMADSYGLYTEGVPLLATTYLVGSTVLGIGAAGLGWWVSQRTVPHVDDEVRA